MLVDAKHGKNDGASNVDPAIAARQHWELLLYTSMFREIRYYTLKTFI